MRYAIYYTPSQNSPLQQAAISWLGYDAFDGRKVETTHGFDNQVSAPRKYGFHGTLKAPFHLAAGSSEKDLRSDFQRFAKASKPFVLPRLELTKIGSFFALVPSEPQPSLQRLADNCVSEFEKYRAPLSDADIKRRKPELLFEQQRQYLLEWGYPYIFDEFRFHLTLTGPVDEAASKDVETALHRHFDAHIGQPLFIDTIAIFEQKTPDASFRVHTAAKLGAGLQLSNQMEILT